MPQYALTLNNLIINHDKVDNSNNYEISMFKSSLSGRHPFYKGLCEVF